MKVYWHWFNWDNMDDSGIVLYSKETGWLEYFSCGFFGQYDKKKEIFEGNRVEAVFMYLGEL